MKKVFMAVTLLLLSVSVYATPRCDHPVFYVQGCEGPPGPPGATGPAGPPGPIGPTGATGPVGPAGTNGIDGVDGVDGATGPQGPVGATGTTGATGATGPAGTDGVNAVSYEDLFDDSRLIGGMAALAAGANIPDVFDGRTGIGVGFSTYRGTEGIAIGILHKVEGLSLRATISTSSGARDVVIGAGATASF